MVEYANVPTLIGTLVSHRAATLIELQTVYGIRDAHNLLEILMVDSHNKRILEASQ